MTKLAEQIKQGADQAWESLSEGWRELSTRASGALTCFWPEQPSTSNSLTAPQNPGPRLTRWTLFGGRRIRGP